VQLPMIRHRLPRAVAQLGSALDWGSRGRRFKSCQPDSEASLVGYLAQPVSGTSLARATEEKKVATRIVPTSERIGVPHGNR
jgi:hypothetical protein